MVDELTDGQMTDLVVVVVVMVGRFVLVPYNTPIMYKMLEVGKPKTTWQ